jgi:hypothetical protein
LHETSIFSEQQSPASSSYLISLRSPCEQENIVMIISLTVRQFTAFLMKYTILLRIVAFVLVAELSLAQTLSPTASPTDPTADPTTAPTNPTAEPTPSPTNPTPSLLHRLLQTQRLSPQPNQLPNPLQLPPTRPLPLRLILPTPRQRRPRIRRQILL